MADGEGRINGGKGGVDESVDENATAGEPRRPRDNTTEEMVAPPATKPLVQPTVVDADDVAPRTVHEPNPPWDRPGNTELGEPPALGELPGRTVVGDAGSAGPRFPAPPAPLAPPIPFAPLPAPNPLGMNATPPINAAPVAYAAAGPRYASRPQGGGSSGLLLIVSGLVGLGLLLGIAITLFLWLRSTDDANAQATSAPSAVPVTVEPEVPPPAAPAAPPPTAEAKSAARAKAAKRPATAAPTPANAPPAAPPPAETVPPAPAESPDPAATSLPAPPPATDPTNTAPAPTPPSEVPRRRRAPRPLGQ